MNGNKAEVEKILKGLKGETADQLDPNVGKLRLYQTWFCT